MTERLPWHEAQWQRIEVMRASGRLPHALMLRGLRGLGKAAFAQRLASALLCESSAPPCGECRGCTLMAAGNHPDFLKVKPEEGKQAIGIDQIRALIDHLVLTTQYRGYKLVIVDPAESMTPQAANTLLKTLEEPPGAAVFILVCHQSGLLPATIRSRCQMLEFPLPPTGLTEPWLKARLTDGAPAEKLLRLAGGVPFRALELSEEKGAEKPAALFGDLAALVARRADPVAVAYGWRAQSAAELSSWFTSLTSDLIRLKSDTACESLTHADLRDAMQPVVRALDLRTLFGLLDLCLEVRWHSVRQTHVNEQLLLEDLAIQWAAARPG
jgi:DNA polymerase-3 subunit delta'